MPHRGSCCLTLLLAVLAYLPAHSQAPANVFSSGGVHPVTLKSDASTATCNECHGNIRKGKYVHTALEMGCTNCHRVQNENGVTRVTLVAPATELCLTCHLLSEDKVLHRPYKMGDCVVCHSPHASDFPEHTWVAHQDICLGCHARSRLKVDEAKKTVTVPWGVTLTFDQVNGWQYLNLNATLTANHPVEGHPVSGPNTPLGPKAPPISCLSCHSPHASNVVYLLPKLPPDPAMPLCKTCGLCSDCHKRMFAN